MSARFVPTVYAAAGGSLPRSHPAIQADFLRQHMRRGWSEHDALARYRAWEAGALEASPVIPRIAHQKAITRRSP